MTPRPHRLSRLRRWGPFAVIAGSYLPAVATVLLASQAWLVRAVPDDAFYYLQIGRNLARGHGATFDGIHHTDGFHPLWQGLMGVLAWLVPGEFDLVRAALVLCLLLSMAGVVLLFRLARDVVGTGPALFGAVLAVHTPGFLLTHANGMEGSLLVFAIAAVMTALRAALRDPRPMRFLVLGALTGAAVLARLDMAAVVWVVPVALWLRRNRRLPLAAWAGACAAATLPYLVWHTANFGRLATGSAVVKTHWTADVARSAGGFLSLGYLRVIGQAAWDYLRALERGVGANVLASSGPLAHVVTVLAVAGAFMAWRSWRRTRGRLSPSALALAVGAVMVAGKAALDVVASSTWATGWYSTPERVALPMAAGVFAWLAVGRLLDALTPERRVRIMALTLLALLALPTYPFLALSAAHERLHPEGWQDATYLAARWAEAHGPRGAYGNTDSGLLGYVLDGKAPVINLDGFVNDTAMVDMVVRKTPVLERARAGGVRYLVARFEPGAPSLKCGTTLWVSPRPVTSGTPIPFRIVDLEPCRGSASG